MPMSPAIPAQVPPHWMPYFQVESVGSSAGTVGALGAKVLVEPRDYPGGRLAVIGDPQGAVFGILETRS